MESQINVGDLVFVKEIDANELEINDIIAFKDKDNLVTTHRIIQILKGKNDICFETKGDNNNTKDQEVVCSRSIEGKYAGKIAKVGSLIIFIQEPFGFGIMMVTILFLGIIIFLMKNIQIDKRFALESEEEKREFEEFRKAKALAEKSNKE